MTQCLCKTKTTPAKGSYDNVEHKWDPEKATTHVELIINLDCPVHDHDLDFSLRPWKWTWEEGGGFIPASGTNEYGESSKRDP